MGVVSAVDDRSLLLTAGEKCKGGGVSCESSFTIYCGGEGKAVAVTMDRERKASRGDATPTNTPKEEWSDDVGDVDEVCEQERGRSTNDVAEQEKSNRRQV